MAEKKRTESIDPDLIGALAHPLRIAILEELLGGPASPNLIAGAIKVPLSNVSYHVKVLYECGAIEADHEAPVRGATEHFYRLVPQAYLGNHHWRKVPVSLRSAASGAGLQQFMDVAVNAIKAGKLDEDQATFEWMPLRLDKQGRDETSVILADARQRLLKAHNASKRRISRNRALAITYIVGLAGFEAAGKLRQVSTPEINGQN